MSAARPRRRSREIHEGLEGHGEYEFLEWLETLRENRIEVNDLRIEVDEWLIWLDRCFDSREANERPPTLEL
ncbi:hypothetical protein PPGU19_091460 (plasmid) [Paraburkholderia sp. PGU19]|nr:hypothetical protein PPGU19_091460 [Paraburkholderia sp. PGU19]